MFYWSFGKNHGDPYYEPTIVVHDEPTDFCVIRNNLFIIFQYFVYLIVLP